MDGPYRLTTQKTAKEKIIGHWYYRYWKGELELKIWGISRFLDPKNTFINHEKAKYWSPKNNPITPNMVALKSGKKYWFDCDKCLHDFESALSDVSGRGRWCPYCCISPKLCGDIECEFCFKKSFASHKMAKCWSKKNDKKPREVTLHSNTKYWFDCDKCHHDFDSMLNDVSKGSWCPYCCIPCKKLCGDIKCEFCFKKSFASHKRAKYWSAKNKLKPHEVTLHSGTKFWFDCDKCPHDFESTLSNVSKGQWCPYCCIPCQKLCGDIKCELCFKKSFASHKRAKCWSDKNKLKPHEVTLHSNTKYWFDCDKCHHDFKSALNHVSHGRWCPYCCISPKLCGDIKCEFCFKKSFASHKRAKYWSAKNKLKPHEVTLNSHTKYWFDCDKCPHDFESVLNGVSNGRWCPTCKNKTEKKLLGWLEKQSWVKKVKHQYNPKWFKYHCIIKGEPKIRSFRYSYDFLVTLQNKKQLIIELDGPQHYRDVPHFKSIALHNQIRDAYKERKARQHKLKVIRTLQEDVWLDRNEWESDLLRKIKMSNASSPPLPPGKLAV